MRFLFKLFAFLALAGSATFSFAAGQTTKSILYGDKATLVVDFGNGSGSIDHGVGSVLSGSTYDVTPVTDTVYTLTVTNAAGDTVTAAITVNVATVSVASVSPATKTLSIGKTFTFSGAAVTGALNSAVTWTATGGTIDAGTGAYTAPATPGVYTVRATSVGDASKYSEATVTVVPLPTITVPLAATQTALQYGGSTTLTATFQDGTGVLDQSIGSVTSPVNQATGALSADTTYTLTVTNAAGDTATSSVTITVTSATMTPINPATKTISLTKTLQFTGGVVTGAVDTSVTWSVVEGDGGTINATGLYTAPAAMPSGGGTVHVKCVSNANGAVLSTATLTLVPLPVINSFTVQ